MVDRVRNANVAVGATGVPIAAELLPKQRQVIVITNISTGGQTITINVGDQAQTVGYGIVLAPGGSWQESVSENFWPSEKDYWAIASAVGGTVAVFERVKADSE